jgi:hypothetical protein
MACAVSPTLASRKNITLSTVPTSGSPEFELLRACCSGKSEITEQIASEVRWERVVPLAEHHGVIPQVYERLSQASFVPEAALMALRQSYEDNTRRALWLTRELMRILDHLGAQGILAVPYKGPVLAAMLYGEVTARQFSDVDVLVRAENVLRTKATLGDLGYKSSLHLTARQTRAYLESGYECTFDGPQGRNLLEVQWQILPRFYAVDFDIERMLERGISVPVGGVMVQTLSPEDMMLVLSVHAAKHAWTRLSWLCDIRQLARSREIHWKWVREESSRLGIARIVDVTFSLVETLLGEMPSEAVCSHGDSGFERIAEKLLTVITGDRELDPESLAYFQMMFRVRERLKDRARLGWRLLTTPGVGEWDSIHLPDPFFPFYRAVRLVRVARRSFN